MSDAIKVNIRRKQVKAKLQSSTDSPSGGFYEETDQLSLAKKMEMEFEKGFNEGLEKGREETEDKYEKLLLDKNQEFYAILTEFENRFAEYEQAFAKIAIETAARISGKIVKKEIAAKSIIQDTLADALTQVVSSNKILVRLNPEDIKLLEAEDGTIGGQPVFSKIRFEPDTSIEQGGCFIETELGNIDARISSQLNEIIKQLELNFVKEDEESADS
jgi:flagellar assembly protein FliH